jgi:putative PIN family toxin of toxin-antitoxin system
MLRIVLDTNVLVASISQKSPFYWVWEGFLQGRYELCVTTEILEEYAEIIERYFTAVDAENTLNQIMLSDNVVQIIRYYEWNVIEQDADDNKFFDCAVAANAHYLVSEDKHFNILKKIPFPSITRLKTKEFQQIVTTLTNK